MQFNGGGMKYFKTQMMVVHILIRSLVNLCSIQNDYLLDQNNEENTNAQLKFSFLLINNLIKSLFGECCIYYTPVYHNALGLLCMYRYVNVYIYHNGCLDFQKVKRQLTPLVLGKKWSQVVSPCHCRLQL